MYIIQSNHQESLPRAVASHHEAGRFKFIDLFAGIGGFRLAMQSVGGQCVFSSEWNKDAQITYFENFGDLPIGDIRDISENDAPDHDVLCAGFPCQPFNLTGVSARNSLNTAHGFACEPKGLCFLMLCG
ncbi:MAG: DNA (cytosine-5-)-methyltransferase [Proteobacteria bacterium]|nr:DNA (cytosine-5-)-methyltransferase [Pseudomonadota bacterium]